MNFGAALAACKPHPTTRLVIAYDPERPLQINDGPPQGEMGLCVEDMLAGHPPQRAMTLRPWRRRHVRPLHVDLKFVGLPHIGDHRVDDPVVLWQRDGALERAMLGSRGSWPAPDLQWIEDRFWRRGAAAAGACRGWSRGAAATVRAVERRAGS